MPFNSAARDALPRPPRFPRVANDNRSGHRGRRRDLPPRKMHPMRLTSLQPRRWRRHRMGGAATGVGGALLSCALILGMGVLPAMAAEAARPNVLFISIDDLNDWVEPFNDPARGKPKIATPNLRKLANRGVAFTNAHTPVPVCRPTRASIMAGVYPRDNRVTHCAVPQRHARIHRHRHPDPALPAPRLPDARRRQDLSRIATLSTSGPERRHCTGTCSSSSHARRTRRETRPCC